MLSHCHIIFEIQLFIISVHYFIRFQTAQMLPRRKWTLTMPSGPSLLLTLIIPGNLVLNTSHSTLWVSTTSQKKVAKADTRMTLFQWMLLTSKVRFWDWQVKWELWKRSWMNSERSSNKIWKALQKVWQMLSVFRPCPKRPLLWAEHFILRTGASTLMFTFSGTAKNNIYYFMYWNQNSIWNLQNPIPILHNTH